MAPKTISLDEEIYHRLKATKRPDETFSEAIERLLPGRSLLDLVGLWSAEEVETVRTTLEAGRARSRDRCETVGTDREADE